MWGKRTPTEDVVHYYENPAPGFWDYRIDHPDGSRTHAINPCPMYPNGFSQTIPKAPKEEVMPLNTFGDYADAAGSMVGVWWLLVFLLWIPFAIIDLLGG